MKRNTTKTHSFKRTAKATALGLAAAGIMFAGSAIAGHHGGKGGHGFKQLFHPAALEAVQATDAQKEQLKKLMKEARAERKANKENREAKRDNMEQRLRTVFSQDTVTAADLDALHEDRKAEFEANKDKRQAHMVAMLNVFTPEQRVKLLELKKERKGDRRNNRKEDRREKRYEKRGGERGGWFGNQQ